MKITQEVIQQPLTVSAHTRQPLRHRVFVASDVARSRSNGSSFGQLTHAISKDQLWHAQASIGRSRARGKSMPTVHTLPLRCPTMPTGSYQTRLEPGQTIAITVSVSAIAGRQIHDCSSLIEIRSMKLQSDLLGKSLFRPCHRYRDTTLFSSHLELTRLRTR